MLKQLVELSLRSRGVVITLAVGLIAYGIYVAKNAKLDVFPDFVQPQVTVQTEAPGLAPEQVEALVTRPVESALNGAGNLDSIRSESIQGLSVVTAVFKEGTDVFIARQMIAERLTQVGGALPAGVATPVMEPLTSSTMDLLKFGLVSDKLSPMELRTFADWTVRPRLLSVPGVAAAKVFGGEVKQLQIQLKPDRLLAFNISVQDVLAAATEATGVRGAGFVETTAQRLVLQTEGQSITPEALGNVVVTQRDGRSIRLRDVADVAIGGEPKFGDAIINGRPGILMTTASQYGANTMEVTVAVEKALDEMKPVFAAEGIQYAPHLQRPASFIEIAIHNIKNSLLLGAALVAAVLFIFLLDWRTALISFTAIPLSLLTAVIVLDHFGATLNTMTLGGLAAVIGVVVDDAIITVENILRRIRGFQAKISGLTPHPGPLPVEERGNSNLESAGSQPSSGKSSASSSNTSAEDSPSPPAQHSEAGGEGRGEVGVFGTILNATMEVRSSVVYATFVVALVFLPVLTMTGLQGKFFAPLGTAFILANLASLVVALTVTPALCFALLSRTKPHEEPNYLRKLKEVHRATLEKVNRKPKTIIAIVLVLFLAALASLPFFGGEFMPDFREGHFVVQITMAPGTSLEDMMRLGKLISADLLKIPAVDSVEEQAGRAQGGEDTWGPHRGEMHVELKPTAGEDQEKVQGQIRATLAQYPGIQSEVLTFLGDRIGETIAGASAQVVINIFGDDLDALDAKANEIKHLLEDTNIIAGAADVQISAPPGTPRIVVQLLPERLTQFGFRPLEVLKAVQTAFQGDVVAHTYEGDKVFGVSVILEPSARRQPEDIGKLLVSNSQGARMPLHELANVYLTTGRYSILHDGARRRQTITCNPAGRDVASFVADAQKAIADKVKMPAGVYVEFSGAAEEQAAAQRELLIHSLIAAAGIILLLAVVFRKGRHLLLVLANLPFALVGGVLAIFLVGVVGGEGASLSLGTLVGFVTLFGITMRNSIMMISHFEHLVNEEGLTWGLETALRGATERLIPISMTALVTALGLLPLAIGSGEAGREIEGPMAIVILGGLVTSTLLNLLVLPTLALRFGRFGPKKPE